MLRAGRGLRVPGPRLSAVVSGRESVKDYGLRVYGHGLHLHGDGRLRGKAGSGRVFIVPPPKIVRGGLRRVAAFSRPSQRRFEFVAANVTGGFRTHLTLTYHANLVEWEDDGARNGRIAQRSKADLNRFLSCLRAALGRYLWVQEFQRRGVVHYHVLCEREVDEARATVAWCRATGEMDDAAAIRHAVRVQAVGVADEAKARAYLSRYLGKRRQKLLPAGVESAGRWWGRSRGLALVPRVEVIVCEAKTVHVHAGCARVVRCVRKYLTRQFGWKYRGGTLVDWGGQLSAKVAGMVETLRLFFGVEWKGERHEGL